MEIIFKCKRSGNTVSFTNENDIAGLRSHDGYEEIKDEEKIEKVNKTHEKRQVLKAKRK